MAMPLRNDLTRAAELCCWLRPAMVKSDVQIGFSSIFWNTSWTGGQPRTRWGFFATRSIPRSPRSRPTIIPTGNGGSSSAAADQWSWTPAQALRPLVQVVPDWFRPQRLGLVFEARSGQGKAACLFHGFEVRPGEPTRCPADASQFAAIRSERRVRASGRRQHRLHRKSVSRANEAAAC